MINNSRRSNPGRTGRPNSSGPGGNAPNPMGNIEGILGGLTGLLGKLQELAEKGQELQREGEGTTQSGKPYRFQYGFNVRTAKNGQGLEVEPFGNVRPTNEAPRETGVEEVREPAVDVFEEDTHVLIVAEMPGIGAEHVKLDVSGDVLTIAAEQGSKRYRKEVLLPGTMDRAKMKVSTNNGVVEIRCER
jgi:HSP20 family protein